MRNIRLIAISVFILSLFTIQQSCAMAELYITPDDIGLIKGSSISLKLFSIDIEGKSVQITNDISWSANSSAGIIDSNGIFTATGVSGIYISAIKATLGDGSEASVNLEIIDAMPSGGFSFERYWSTGANITTDYPPNGNFSIPCDVTVDSNNIVYVADTGNNRIQKFYSDGTFLDSWNESQGFYIPVPWSISLDNAGNIISSDYMFDTSGIILQTFAPASLPMDEFLYFYSMMGMFNSG